MSKLALIAIFVLAGCAAKNTRPPGPDPKITSMEEERHTVAERENQRIESTLTRSRDEMAGVAATPNPSTKLQVQKQPRERDWELMECRARADQENAQISVRERAEYANQAQQGHDQAALMMILTTSKPR